VQQHHYAKHDIISPSGDTSLKHVSFCDIINEKGAIFMKENKLAELSLEFSVDIINLVKYLKSQHESIISNQIGRSGTSIGANIHEAQYAQGKKDFISKLEIALKEASETGYWLTLLHRTNYIDDQLYKTLSSKCAALRVMLIASCKTAKENLNG
jgi:four helix bundle protein